MNEPKITYRGWAGHFICAHRCKFRLNTLVEYEDIKLVISTVGLMMLGLNDKDLYDFQRVGHDRHFETMIFHAHFKNGFWDADVGRGEVGVPGAWSLASIEDENLANDNHIRIVGEICEGLKTGNKYKPDREDEEASA